MRLIQWLFMCTASLALVGCEDQIYPTLEPAAPVLVVDAWLDNRPVTQTIVLTQSQPYFENLLPPGVSGAVVTVTDDLGRVFTFVEDDQAPGYYRWIPAGSDSLGPVGRKFNLQIIAGGETFVSTSRLGRVPAIDSITFQKDKRIGGTDSLTRAEFWATDPAGKGDAYWIRSWKNGVLLNKPSEINIAYDAGFSIGGATDGVTFITPIRRRINPNDQDENNRVINPFVPGDSIYVQIHSVTTEAFTFLNEVSIQTDRPGGFQELFSTPLANVSTNITNTNASGSKALGFFNVASITGLGKRYH